ncbi:hypothetical protein HMPREF1317_0166 [Schaalia georgiae F0490]|uniref:Uncharacterized protein n=1 Tax=Schaalia georgiae F0490 TaxID=1125717 RepID=J0MMB1_9ACTO|nr:hypothetical protein HMPREF1317_0166 [Schaalia georgiae F0490]
MRLRHMSTRLHTVSRWLRVQKSGFVPSAKHEKPEAGPAS